MQTIEFQAAIKNGVVHIPKKYSQLQQQQKANFVISYEQISPNNKQKMTSISINTKKYSFDRESANER